jgi:predicted DNA-binding transcriptional regulator AlpA
MEQRRDTRPTGLLVSAKEAAAMCGMSLRTWWRKDAAGHVPAAVRIGGGSMKRWRLEELRGWCVAGCPSREEWEAMVAAGSKGR